MLEWEFLSTGERVFFIILFSLLFLVLVGFIVGVALDFNHPFQYGDYCSRCGEQLVHFCPGCNSSYRVFPDYFSVCGYPLNPEVSDND